MLPHEQQGKPAVAVQMPSLIRAKVFVTRTGSLINFGEFAILVYDEVMKHALNYDRLDLVFDQYFKKSLKERTRSGREESSQYLSQYLFELGQLLLQHQTNHTRTWFWYFCCFTFFLSFYWMWYCFQFLW